MGPVVRFLSDEWMAAMSAAAAGSDRLAAATASTRLAIQQVIWRGPGDEVAYVVRVDHGAVTVEPGRADDVDVTVTEDLDTAVAVARGELNPQVAFMTGRVRVAGDIAALLAGYQALADLEDVFEAVRAATSYDT